MKHISIYLLVSACVLSSCAKTVTPQRESVVETPTTQQATETPSVTTPEVTPTQPTKTEDIMEKSFTVEEVATHKNGLSCWLILDNKVYDVTTFIGKHPGGEAILR